MPTYREALEKIAKLCASSSFTTHRIEQIYDVTLEALGHTANQREFHIRTMRESALEKQRTRQQQRRAINYTED